APTRRDARAAPSMQGWAWPSPDPLSRPTVARFTASRRMAGRALSWSFPPKSPGTSPLPLVAEGLKQSASAQSLHLHEQACACIAPATSRCFDLGVHLG